MLFADYLLEKRINLILNQKEFADFLEVSLSNIKSWERGYCLPNCVNMLKIKEKLKDNTIEGIWKNERTKRIKVKQEKQSDA